ncbi:LysM peptidoglycan-binding domain-containing protein [Rhodovulum euryhalinum]|uniref:Nucleoid-associated protein YgaU n=1 Tax=Rhodovulum euryhalinum TaxID=35805 RepID=A0A4R2KBT4_9RHOB|nr:LysM peptidoglycan-binding domain-containing protein [Rhodovulum euryhalinum]TCO70961.1 nucleoid-associated protein YgaU [Rhodovulum euryhalinum]
MSDGKRKWGLWTWILIGGEILIVLMVLNWFLNRDRARDTPAPVQGVPEQGALPPQGAEQAAMPAPAVGSDNDATLLADAPDKMADEPPADRAAQTAEGDAPATPEPAAALPEPPVFDLVRVDPGGAALVAGRAEPGSAVVLLIEGREGARAEVGADGAFTLFLDLPLASVPRALSLRMDLADGRRIASSATVFLAPDPAGAEIAAPAPTSAEPPPAVPGEDVQDTVAATEGAGVETGPVPSAEAAAADAAPGLPAVLLSDAGGVRVLQAPEGDLPPGKPGLLIEAISYDARGAVVLAGRGEAGGALRLYLDNAAVAGARIDAAGRWRQRLDGVAPGLYTLRADLVTPEGGVAARFETPFQREPAEEIAAAASEGDKDGAGREAAARVITVQPGFTLWGIADRAYGSGFQYVKIFSANRTQIRDPDLIYPGQVFDLPE